MSKIDRPNISTEHAPEGSAQRPSDTLGQKVSRDRVGGTTPDNRRRDADKARSNG